MSLTNHLVSYVNASTREGAKTYSQSNKYAIVFSPSSSEIFLDGSSYGFNGAQQHLVDSVSFNSGNFIFGWTNSTNSSTFDLKSTFIPNSSMGVANGVATLNDTGLIPSEQLPSYVDDVIETVAFYTLATSLPAATSGCANQKYYISSNKLIYTNTQTIAYNKQLTASQITSGSGDTIIVTIPIAQLTSGSSVDVLFQSSGINFYGTVSSDGSITILDSQYSTNYSGGNLIITLLSTGITINAGDTLVIGYQTGATYVATAPEIDKIYVNKSIWDTNPANTTYRWTGSTMIAISQPITITNTPSSTDTGAVISAYGVYKALGNHTSISDGSYVTISSAGKIDLTEVIPITLGGTGSNSGITYSLSGSGNVVTAVTATGRTVTVTKGITALTDFSGFSSWATSNYVTFAGLATTNDLSVGRTINVVTNASIGGTLRVSGDASLLGTVHVPNSSIIGNLTGNASTAENFKTNKTITLTGDVTSTAASGGAGQNWSITTTIPTNSIANTKLTNSSIKIGTNSVSLGGTMTSIAGVTTISGTSDLTIGGKSYFTGDVSLGTGSKISLVNRIGGTTPVMEVANLYVGGQTDEDGDASLPYLVSTLDISVNGLQAEQITINGAGTVSSGVPPLVVSSLTKCDNLNADMVDGMHASDFATTAHTHATLTLQENGTTVTTYNTANASTFNVIACTSIGVPTGLSVSQITNGKITISTASGYEIPTTASLYWNEV